MRGGKKTRPKAATAVQDAHNKIRFQYTAPAAEMQGPERDFSGPALVQLMERAVLGREKVSD